MIKVCPIQMQGHFRIPKSLGIFGKTFGDFHKRENCVDGRAGHFKSVIFLKVSCHSPMVY
jgi:hypothetical protein